MAGLPEDYMARVAATYGDPSAFSELVFGTPLHGGQRRYVREHNGQVNFLLPGNSWGKTEFVVRYSFYLAWFKIGESCPHPSDFEKWLHHKYVGLVASYTYDIAEESLRRLREYRKARPEVNALIAKLPESEGECTFTNGSVIHWGSLDGKGRLVEGLRTQFIFVDEAGHIPDLSYTFDNILFPRTMGVAGVIHLLGTPKEYSDPYLMEVYERGKAGGDGFHFSQSGTVFENEFWPQHERDRVLNNPRYVTGWTPCQDPECDFPVCVPLRGHPVMTPVGRQVILGAFVLAGSLFFNRFSVARMFAWEGEDPEWTGDDHFYFKPKPGRLYAAAFDLAGNKLRSRSRKKGSDPTVGFVIDHTERPWKVARFDYIRGGDADWEDKYRLMGAVYATYNIPYLLIDATGNIDSVQEALEARGVSVEGVSFSGNSHKKLDMLRNLQLCLELEWGKGQRGILRSPLIPKLKHELEHYVLPDETIEQDCVIALAMVCWYVSQWDCPESLAEEVY